MKNKLQIPFVGVVEIDILQADYNTLQRIYNTKCNVKIVVHHEDDSIEMLKFYENQDSFLVGKWEKMPTGTFDLVFTGIIAKSEIGRQRPTKKVGFFKKLLECCY
jgi:hypothetical protein